MNYCSLWEIFICGERKFHAKIRPQPIMLKFLPISYAQSSVVLVMQFTYSFSFSQNVDLLLVLVLVKMSIYF